MLTTILAPLMASFAKSKPPRTWTLRARLKHYGSMPQKYQLRTRIRPPNLRDPALAYPIYIPIRYRHIYRPQAPLYTDNTSKVHWNRLEPNQILLAFENLQSMSFGQMVEGLRYLSKVQGQQKHDWNTHEWVSGALNRIRDNFNFIKKRDVMNFYRLMRKLNYKDETFWKKLYAKMEQEIYELYAQDFGEIFLRYYDNLEQVFSDKARDNFHQLMHNRIRQFTPAQIVQVFRFYLRDKKLDTYWLENVFISLFKDIRYQYSAKDLGAIFRAMMVIGHENNERLYTNLYGRIEKQEIATLEEVDDLTEVLEEVKEIFKTHRVEPTLEALAAKREQIAEGLKKEKKKTIEQMVKDDLKYFMEKRKLKSQEKGTQGPATVA